MQLTTMGDRLRRYRQEKNLTLKVVGKQLNLDPSAISKYETGKREPALSTLKAMAELYHVPLESLLGAHQNTTPAVRTYHITVPFIHAFKPSTTVIFFIYIIGLLAHGLLAPEHNARIIFIPIGAGILIIKELVDVLLRRPGGIKTIDLAEEETLVFDHPYTESHIQDIRRQDFFTHVGTLALTFLLCGFYIVAIDDVGVALLISWVFIINLATMTALIVMITLKFTDRKTMLYDETNRLFNRLKYAVHFGVSIFSASVFFYFYPLIRVYFPTNIAILVYLLAVFYLGLTMRIFYQKHRFHRLYRMVKH